MKFDAFQKADEMKRKKKSERKTKVLKKSSATRKREKMCFTFPTLFHFINS